MVSFRFLFSTVSNIRLATKLDMSSRDGSFQSSFTSGFPIPSLEIPSEAIPFLAVSTSDISAIENNIFSFTGPILIQVTTFLNVLPFPFYPPSSSTLNSLI